MKNPEGPGTRVPGRDASADAPAAPLAPRAVAHYPMWMWRCAVVLPHPALQPGRGPAAMSRPPSA